MELALKLSFIIKQITPSLRLGLPIWKWAQYGNNNCLTAFGEAMYTECLAQPMTPTLLSSSIPR